MLRVANCLDVERFCWSALEQKYSYISEMQQKTKIDIVQLIKRDTLWLSARFHKTLKKEAILFKNHSEISKWQPIQINTAYYSNQSKLDNQIIGRSKVEKLLSGFMTVKSNLFSRSGSAALK